jgi:hypothetical protein
MSAKDMFFSKNTTFRVAEKEPMPVKNWFTT